MKLINQEKFLATAAAKAGMSDKTARKYRNLKQLPSQCSPEHDWSTHPDVFARVWSWVELQLKTNDGICLKRIWGGEVRNVSVLVAVGVGADGYRHILGVVEGAKEDKESWASFLRHLKERGLKGVQLVISDKCLGLVEAAEESPSSIMAGDACAIGTGTYSVMYQERR